MIINIAEFYRDKTILITGCTGFLGKSQIWLIHPIAKVILEKFIFSVRDFKKIYVLIRPKKTKKGTQSVA